MAAFEVLDFWPDWDAAAGGAAVTVTWSAAGSTAAPPGPPCVMFGDALARPFSQPSAAPVLPACRMPHGRHPPWHRAAACRAALCCRTRCEALSGCAQRQSGRCAPPQQLSFALSTWLKTRVSPAARAGAHRGAAPGRAALRGAAARAGRRAAVPGAGRRRAPAQQRAALPLPRARRSGRERRRVRLPPPAPASCPPHAQANAHGALALAAPSSHWVL